MEALEKEKRELQEALNKQDIKMLKEQEVLSKFLILFLPTNIQPSVGLKVMQMSF